ncbi:MAG: D-tyrosyl-tRNA(Tyr) deacylase [Opitutus sp.]|nr:D-tyrosyl-tRNA(Tyr) deacylase [Opitutus sp.]
MRAVVQRVSSARVTVAGDTTGEIGPGLLIFLGIAQGDTAVDGEWLVQKIAALRIFEDAAGKMNRSVVDLGGGALVVSQFTLLASTAKGTRPSFNAAAPPALAIPLYEKFVAQLAGLIGRPVATGRFGAMMEVALVNAGPVTLVLDSRQRE